MKLDGHEIAETIYSELKGRVSKLGNRGIIPHLVVFLVGESPASVAYVTLKQKKGEEIDAKVTILKYNTDVSQKELEDKLKQLNDDPTVHAILIQRPLPTQIDAEKLELLTNPEKDVDGFHPNSPYTLPLPLAVVKILEEVYKYKIVPTFVKRAEEISFIDWLKTQNIVLIGKGPTGGGPIIACLKKDNITPHIIDSKTKNPDQFMKQADIIISATGHKNTVSPEHLKQGVILISVGINRDENNKLHGDYDEKAIEEIASYYTPTPGGVGPVNVAMLIDNLLSATEGQTK
jgi:methylenetetrahydrofolate dehydrogenase (NADP+)/methenyltetrahydrofolate cyclohydrolase